MLFIVHQNISVRLLNLLELSLVVVFQRKQRLLASMHELIVFFYQIVEFILGFVDDLALRHLERLSCFLESLAILSHVLEEGWACRLTGVVMVVRVCDGAESLASLHSILIDFFHDRIGQLNAAVWIIDQLILF